MERFLIVVASGGLGSGARYLVGIATGERTFPAATLIVNLVGSFLIAVCFEVALRNKSISPNLTLALTTGFMGGFTTYSSFNYQTTALAMNGHTGKAAINVIVTLIGCILAGLAGIWLARRLA